MTRWAQSNLRTCLNDAFIMYLNWLTCSCNFLNNCRFILIMTTLYTIGYTVWNVYAYLILETDFFYHIRIFCGLRVYCVRCFIPSFLTVASSVCKIFEKKPTRRRDFQNAQLQNNNKFKISKENRFLFGLK